MRKIAHSQELQLHLRRILVMAQEPSPSRKVLAVELHKLARAVSRTAAIPVVPPGLQKLVRKIQHGLLVQTESLDMSNGDVATTDLKKMKTLLDKAGNSLDGSGFGEDDTDPFHAALDEVAAKVDESISQIEDEGLLEDEPSMSESEAQEFLEELVNDVVQLIQDII